jgi:DNA-binding response OmpR family regulator
MVGERLAPREYMLLKLLVEAQGHVVERKRIEEAVWGADAYDDNALHQLVRRTREKIGDDAGSPKILLTLPGVGYRLNVAVDMPAG